MIMMNELGLEDMTGAICHLFLKYDAIFARVTETIAILQLLMTNFDKGINGHAIVKIVLITKLQMYVLAQKHYKVSLLLLILII